MSDLATSTATPDLPSLPPVERVHGGVWSVPVPIPDNPLGCTLVYLVETRQGPVLVDAGWDDPGGWAALDAGVQATGHDLAEVYGLLVTHHHPDHHGLSGRVRAASGCWVAMHEVEADVVARWRRTGDRWALEAAATLLEAGAGQDEVARLTGRRRHRPPASVPVEPDRLLADGERADVPGRDVRAVWTPGHTPGHLCFVLSDADGVALLSGDHVLPRITPNVGLWHDDPDADPLGDYLRSLAALRDLPVQQVLPAHEHRFAGLADRVDALVEHHDARLRRIVERLSGGPATAWQLTAALPWNRAWADLPAMMRRAAVSEALAHVRVLERRGVVRQVRTAPRTYALVGR